MIKKNKNIIKTSISKKLNFNFELFLLVDLVDFHKYSETYLFVYKEILNLK